jgi:hypothetical protein
MLNIFGDEVSILTPDTRSKRTQAWHRNAAHRLGKMHGAYGKDAEGRSCSGCVHLTNDGGRWLKCKLAGVSSSDATDWRAKWPACGRRSDEASGSER